MKKPRDSYPQALIPEHLTRLSIDTLPYDTPFYLSMENSNNNEPLSIYVDHKKKLRMNRLVDVDPEDASIDLVPVAAIGVMRSYHIDPSTHDVRDIYLADLRMIDVHSLVNDDEAAAGALGPDDYADYVSLLNNSITFDGLIIADADSMEKDDMPEGALYGDKAYYPQLEKLGKQTTHLIRHALEESGVFNTPEATPGQHKSLQSRLERLSRSATGIGRRAIEASGLGKQRNEKRRLQ